MAVGGNALSRNPNLCASCSSILDGMDDVETVEPLKPADKPAPLPDKRSEEVHNPA
jgi:hypothetical protein